MFGVNNLTGCVQRVDTRNCFMTCSWPLSPVSYKLPNVWQRCCTLRCVATIVARRLRPTHHSTRRTEEITMTDIRKETDSLGEVDVAADKLWGAQTQRSLEHFSIGKDLIPPERITAYAILKKSAGIANHASKRLDHQRHKLIFQACVEILAGKHPDMFPLHVWKTGSGNP